MGVLSSLGGALVNGAKFVNRNKLAIAGGVLTAEGAAIIKGALQNPEFINNSRYQYSELTFPEDLVTSERSFYITMQFMEYQRRSIFDQPFLDAKGGIRLPIPNQLVDTMAVTYDQAEAPGAVGAAIEQGLKGRNKQGSSDGAGILQGLAGAAKGAVAGGALGALTGLAQAVGAPVEQGLQLGGLAQNPFLTVLFKQPQFKRHQFSWKLTPNNERESNNLRDIILTLKSNMLPAMAPSAGGTLLKYPNMAIISLSPNQDYLYKFKPCVIESMSVNYASAGMPSFFKRSDAPVDVTISLNLLEIEYWLKEDIEDPSGAARAAAAAVALLG
jgi:hypothetical protein